MSQFFLLTLCIPVKGPTYDERKNAQHDPSKSLVQPEHKKHTSKCQKRGADHAVHKLRHKILHLRNVICHPRHKGTRPRTDSQIPMSWFSCQSGDQRDTPLLPQCTAVQRHMIICCHAPRSVCVILIIHRPRLIFFHQALLR